MSSSLQMNYNLNNRYGVISHYFVTIVIQLVNDRMICKSERYVRAFQREK